MLGIYILYMCSVLLIPIHCIFTHTTIINSGNPDLMENSMGSIKGVAKNTKRRVYNRETIAALNYEIQ